MAVTVGDIERSIESGIIIIDEQKNSPGLPGQREFFFIFCRVKMLQNKIEGIHLISFLVVMIRFWHLFVVFCMSRCSWVIDLNGSLDITSVSAILFADIYQSEKIASEVDQQFQELILFKPHDLKISMLEVGMPLFGICVRRALVTQWLHHGCIMITSQISFGIFFGYNTCVCSTPAKPTCDLYYRVLSGLWLQHYLAWYAVLVRQLRSNSGFRWLVNLY